MADKGGTGCLAEVVYRVTDPASLAGWYSAMLGMEVGRLEGGAGWWGGYTSQSTRLVWRPGPSDTPYTPSPAAAYWKGSLHTEQSDTIQLVTEA